MGCILDHLQLCASFKDLTTPMQLDRNIWGTSSGSGKLKLPFSMPDSSKQVIDARQDCLSSSEEKRLDRSPPLPIAQGALAKLSQQLQCHEVKTCACGLTSRACAASIGIQPSLAQIRPTLTSTGKSFRCSDSSMMHATLFRPRPTARSHPRCSANSLVAFACPIPQQPE